MSFFSRFTALCNKDPVLTLSIALGASGPAMVYFVPKLRRSVGLEPRDENLLGGDSLRQVAQVDFVKSQQ